MSWKLLAESRLKALGCSWGEPVSSGMLLGQIRHLFSVVSVNPRDDCLLTRVRGAGCGTEAAGWGGSSGMPRRT